ncbi:MAG: hypothetical protein N2449_06110, partial [Bacteroidales bacterium]|nr:hypothetical protein [Bacteroidales bacterium]
MKTIGFLFLAFILFFNNANAQIPQGISYQAVVRNSQGNIVANQNVAFRFSIIQQSINGNVVYSERQTTTTNNFGLVNLAIGTGQVLNGNFTNIAWSQYPHFLKVELDIQGGTNYLDMGTTQLLSVPYALVAQRSISDTLWVANGNHIHNTNSGRVGIGINNPTGKVTIQGDTSNVLFEVKDKDGKQVFVVYQDSVYVFVDASGTKTNKGTFAVSSKAQTKNNAQYLRITPDSSRIYT